MSLFSHAIRKVHTQGTFGPEQLLKISSKQCLKLITWFTHTLFKSIFYYYYFFFWFSFKVVDSARLKGLLRFWLVVFFHCTRLFFVIKHTSLFAVRVYLYDPHIISFSNKKSYQVNIKWRGFIFYRRVESYAVPLQVVCISFTILTWLILSSSSLLLLTVIRFLLLTLLSKTIFSHSTVTCINWRIMIFSKLYKMLSASPTLSSVTELLITSKNMRAYTYVCKNTFQDVQNF